MTTRYLEFDSSYRNRNLYPYPSDFVIEMSQSGQKSQNTALDPVSNASPILSWNNSFQESAASNSVTHIAIIGTGASTPTIVRINIDNPGVNPDTFRQINNFYVGANLYLGSTVSRKILDYKYINLTQAIVTLDSAIPDANMNSNTFAITNPTYLATNTASAVIKFYIPTGSFIDNFYRGYYIGMINPVLGTAEYRLITSYDGTTRLATLESATALDWIATGIGANYNFVIRKEIPISTGTMPDTAGGGTTAVSSSGRVLQLSNSLSIASSINYVNSAIRMTTPSPVAPFSTTSAPYGEERIITKFVGGDGTFVAVAGTTFTLSSSASTVDNYYTGSFITAIVGGVNQTRMITSYTGSTRSGTVSVAFVGAVAGNTWFIRSITISSPFSVNPSLVPVTNTYEIEAYTRENCIPFSYSGSMVSLTEGVCYEVELLNLIMPNSTLASGRGGRPAFYPYMYLELEQLSCSNSGNNGLIYSNNPNSFKMMYRVPMDDTPTPLISTFIKVDGDGMTHTIKFRPNDSFRMSIHHASGELFQPVASDYYSPTEPNPMVQISACFAFKRV